MSMSRPRRQSRTPMPDLRGECVCSSSFAARRRLPHAAPRGHRRGTLMCTKATIAATEHFASIGDDGLRSSHRLVDEVNDRTKHTVKHARGTRCAIRSLGRRSPASGLQDSTENGSGAIAAAVLLLVFFPSAWRNLRDRWPRPSSPQELADGLSPTQARGVDTSHPRCPLYPGRRLDWWTPRDGQRSDSQPAARRQA